MWITEFKDYKAFIKATIRTFPQNGRGQMQRLARHLSVSPMVISHILTRKRDLTPDQALRTAEYFGFDERTTEYFVDLVHLGRASTRELRAYYEQKLSQLREQSQNIKNLVQGREELSDVDKGMFYSNWYYSGVRLLSSIEKFQTTEAIAGYFGLSRAKVGEIVSFLVTTGLCVQDSSGRIKMGPKATHVSSTSEFVNSHRKSWRDKAREKFTEPGEDDLFYSSPVSLSKKDAEIFRKELLELIKNFSKQVADSPAEQLMCLNIDWFKF